MNSIGRGRTLRRAATSALLYSVVALTLATKASAQTTGAGATTDVWIHELPMRRSATATALPDYPKPSLERGVKGVAVVQVVIDGGGAVVSAVVLQAPDAACGEASTRAARRWMFAPTTAPDGRRARVHTKLTFYFDIDQRKVGRVTAGGAEYDDELGPEARRTRLAGWIDGPGIERLVAAGHVILLDIRDRQDEPAPIRTQIRNIPVGEIWARARDLGEPDAVVILCAARMDAVCELAAREVARSTRTPRVYIGPYPTRK